jgi:hypothetical protein
MKAPPSPRRTASGIRRAARGTCATPLPPPASTPPHCLRTLLSAQASCFSDAQVREFFLPRPSSKALSSPNVPSSSRKTVVPRGSAGAAGTIGPRPLQAMKPISCLQRNGSFCTDSDPSQGGRPKRASRPLRRSRPPSGTSGLRRLLPFPNVPWEGSNPPFAPVR